MKKILAILFYFSAFFMPWGSGMQLVIPHSSTIFPVLCVLIIAISLFFDKGSFNKWLPRDYKFFVYFVLIHTAVFIALTFDSELTENADGYMLGASSFGDSITKFVLFFFYAGFLSKSLFLKYIDITRYSFFFILGFSLTILLGGFSGGYTDPNAMAVDALISFALCLFLIKSITSDRIIKKVPYIVLSGIALFAVIMSFSRGAMLTLAVLALFILGSKYHIGKLFGYSLLLIGILCFVYIYFFPSEFKDLIEMRFDMKEAIESGGANRTFIWQAYLERWPYYFITGTGFQNCPSVLKAHSAGVSFSLNYVTHNQYLLYFVEQGLIGLILYLRYFFFGYKTVVKSNGPLFYLGIPFISYAVATFFVNLSGGRTGVCFD